MSMSSAMALGQEGLILALLLCAPALGVGLLVGLGLSFLQAVTQLQDQSLSFTPKIAAIAITMILCGPWMAGRAVGFLRHVLESLPDLAR